MDKTMHFNARAVIVQDSVGVNLQEILCAGGVRVEIYENGTVEIRFQRKV